MIRILQEDHVGLGYEYTTHFTGNTFSKNHNFQQLGFGSQSYYRGSLVHVDLGDQSALNRIELRLSRL